MSVFSHIRTEYGDLLRNFSSNKGKHFSHSDTVIAIFAVIIMLLLVLSSLFLYQQGKPLYKAAVLLRIINVLINSYYN